MSDGNELVGYVTLRIDGRGVRLMFSGPSLPVVEGVQPTLSLLYDTDRRRVRVMAGVQAQGDDDPSQHRPDAGQSGGGDDDNSFEVDLLSLPDEYQRLIQNRQTNRTMSIPLATPNCAALQRGGDFMTYREYRQLSTQASRPAPRPPAVPFNPLDPNVLRQGAAAVIYPPLTKPMFDRLVARCRGRRLLGMQCRLCRGLPGLRKLRVPDREPAPHQFLVLVSHRFLWRG